LGLSHLRVDLRLPSDGWSAALRQAVKQARSVGARVHAALFVSDHAGEELARLSRETAALATDGSPDPTPPVSLWIVFHERERSTGPRWVGLARQHLAGLAPGVPFAAGTDAHFAELNRGRPVRGAGALPCFSISPQVHAFDDRTLVENLEAQAAAVETARAFGAGPVVVSPVTLRPRFNAVATAEEAPSPDVLPPAVDARQMSWLGAAWTLGSLARLATVDGVHSLTYYETTGWRGVMETEAGSPRPDLFPSTPGAVFPVYHVLAGLAGCVRVAPLPGACPPPIAGLCGWDAGGRPRVLLANLSDGRVKLEVEAGGHALELRMLDETSGKTALVDPESFLDRPGRRIGASEVVTLEPYALARVDG
jgi:hypothetical protein